MHKSPRIFLLYKGKVRRDITFYADVLACMFIEHYIATKQPIEPILHMGCTEASEHINSFVLAQLNSEIRGSKRTLNQVYLQVHNDIKEYYKQYIN